MGSASGLLYAFLIIELLLFKENLGRASGRLFPFPEKTEEIKNSKEKLKRASGRPSRFKDY